MRHADPIRFEWYCTLIQSSAVVHLSISLVLVMGLKKREGERVGEEKMHGRGLSPDFPASQHESIIKLDPSAAIIPRSIRGNSTLDCGQGCGIVTHREGPRWWALLLVVSPDKPGVSPRSMGVGEVNAERSKCGPVRSSLYSYSHHSVNKEVVGEETRRLRHSWRVSGTNGQRCEPFAQDVGILVPTSRHLQSADCETSKLNITKTLLLSSPIPSFCLSSIKSQSFLEDLFQFQEKRTNLEA